MTSDLPTSAELRAGYREEVRQLRRDSDVLQAVVNELRGWSWLGEGRGPYEWDDGRYDENVREFVQRLQDITTNVQLWEPYQTVLNRLNEARGAVRRYESVMAMDTAWPLPAVLEKLIEASGTLLNQKMYDGHGWELIEHARAVAITMLATLNRETEPTE